MGFKVALKSTNIACEWKKLSVHWSQVTCVLDSGCNYYFTAYFWFLYIFPNEIAGLNSFWFD